MRKQAVPLIIAAVAAIATLGAATRGRSGVRAGGQPLSFVLAPADAGRTIERPFTVPPGVESLSIEPAVSTTDDGALIEIGLRGPSGLRGWSGPRHAPIVVSRISASYGYLPGPIEPGQWTIVVGVGRLRAPATCTFEIVAQAQPAMPRPRLRSTGGWLAGDLHMHSGHSDGYTRATGIEAPIPVADIVERAGRQHLDFIAVTDHNTTSHWADLDRLQPAAPGTLLLHGREMTTYRGHFNAIGGQRFTEFALGPMRPLRSIAADAAADGAFVSINHPVLPDDDECIRCGWMDTDDETVRQIHGVEIVNGATDDPQLAGWRFWAALLNRGHRLVAVGGSDTHDPRHGTIGYPTTMVRAATLWEPALVDALKAGRVYVRSSPAAPRLESFSAATGDATYEMGSAMPPGSVTLSARLVGAQGQALAWIRRGAEMSRETITAADAVAHIDVAASPGDWFSVILRTPGGDATLFSNALSTSR
jgi:hypothetical protein